MHLDIELKVGDIVKIKEDRMIVINDDLQFIITKNTKLILTDREQLGYRWTYVSNCPEIQFRIREIDIAWVERH